MKKILLAGATGHLGRYIYRELKQHGFEVRVLARQLKNARMLSPDPEELLLADATQPEALEGCCAGIDVVVSAMGKNISLRNQDDGSFQEIDYKANLNLLREASNSDVQQFVYVSAFGAAQYPGLAYFRAHADFENSLRSSGLNYTILQPVALFSAFEELVALARKGKIASLGRGTKKTNPIFEGDVAKVAVSAIGQPDQVIPLGGSRTYTRMELVRIACAAAGYTGKIKEVPVKFIESLLPFARLLSRSLYDKLAFMVAVSKADCLAPAVGELSLEEYFELEPQLST